VIVVDSNVVIDLLFRAKGSVFTETTLVSGEPLAAPDHMIVETARVLRRRQISGIVDPETASEMLDEAIGLGIASHSNTDLIPRAWSLRNQFTLDDALYVALAEAVDGTLLTGDRKLASHASRFVEVSVPG